MSSSPPRLVRPPWPKNTAAQTAFSVECPENIKAVHQRAKAAGSAAKYGHASGNEREAMDYSYLIDSALDGVCVSCSFVLNNKNSKKYV